MRALILVAVAALAVSACSKNEAAENTMNVDETLTTENVVANDTMAIAAANGLRREILSWCTNPQLVMRVKAM